MRTDRRFIGRSAGALGLTVISTLAFGTVAAQAATVSVAGTELLYSAEAGEVNQVRAFSTPDRTAVIVTERGARADGNPLTFTRGAGCTATISNNAREARCAGVTSLRVNALDQNDNVVNDTSYVSTLDLGVGDDVGAGGLQNTTTQVMGDTMIGGEGKDILNGRAGNDTYSAGAGDDLVDADEQDLAAGADNVDCGDGADVAYADPSDTVNANCESRTRQPASATDAGATTPPATTSPTPIGTTIGTTPTQPGTTPATRRGTSRACATRARGTRKGDKITGTRGGDRLYGLGGNDVIKGLAGDDCLYGAAGKDRLTGGAGKDRIYGGSGNDVIAAKDGTKDTVNCGGGRDTAKVDRIDRVVGCEKVTRS